METTFILKGEDLNIAFLKALKSLFKKDQEITVQISSKQASNALRNETQKETNIRIEKSYQNLKNNKNTVSFTGEEFEALVQKLNKK